MFDVREGEGFRENYGPKFEEYDGIATTQSHHILYVLFVNVLSFLSSSFFLFLSFIPFANIYPHAASTYSDLLRNLPLRQEALSVLEGS